MKLKHKLPFLVKKLTGGKMAKKKWIIVSGGRIKRWKTSKRGCCFGYGVPLHW